MPGYRHQLMSLFIVVLSGCGDAQSPVSTTAAAAPASNSTTKQGDSGMFKECQGATVHLTALAKDGGSPRSTRLETERDGQRREIEAPAEMEGYSAVGLACAQDKSGAPYFVVEYGELPYGCSFCEWYYLYDASGKQLTHSTPPLRDVDGQQAPNNDEYSRLLAELGIQHPEVEPFEL